MTDRFRRSLPGFLVLVALLGAVAAAPAKGVVTVFAKVPDPGHPLGVGVDGGRVYVATSAGLPVHINTKGERLFTYTSAGKLDSTTVIDTGPVSNMGLFGIAFDGKRGAGHHVFVSDMNGRILRFALTPRPSTQEVYAQIPLPYGAGGWNTSMPNDIAFDAKGTAYVTDDKPRLWRIPPGGEPEVWFEDPTIAGFTGDLGGPFGGRIGPDGKFYFAVTQAPGPDQAGVVFRLPLVDHPSAGDLEEFHRFPAENGAAPQIMGLAFGESGRLYVALMGADQIAVLDRAGKEVRRVSSPLFASPFGVAFLGTSLLVANGDFTPEEHPDHWLILRVAVGEEGLPLARPTNLP